MSLGRGRCRIVGILVGVVVVTVTIILIVIVTMHLVVEFSVRVVRVVVAITLRPMHVVVGVGSIAVTAIAVTLVGCLANHLDILPCIIISWKFNCEYVTV